LLKTAIEAVFFTQKPMQARYQLRYIPIQAEHIDHDSLVRHCERSEAIHLATA
jgi:hypothetical protein